MSLSRVLGELASAPVHHRSRRVRAQEDERPHGAHHQFDDVPRSHRDHRHHSSDRQIKRRRVVEADYVVNENERSWSHDSSREFYSHRAEPPSELDWGETGQGAIKESARSKRVHLLSPPPDASKWGSHGDSNYPRSSSKERRSRELHGFGSWCGPVRDASPDLQIEALDDYEEIAQHEGPAILTAPTSPREHLMAAPELSPLPIDYVFCPCCEDDQDDRINETWHMVGKDKMDAQVEYALEYIARMRSEGQH